MRLKAKLISLIASFCLVIAIVSIGVWAAGSGTVTIGGTVSFNATDVFCDVTGSFANVQGTAPAPEKLSWSASSEPTDFSSWKNMAINYDEDATPIVFTITIKNNSDERFIKVKLTDTADTTKNLTKTVKFDGQLYTLGEEVKVLKSETKSFEITFTYSEPDLSFSDAPWGYSLSLVDENFTA